MKRVLKVRWFIIVAWVLAIALLITTAPNMAELVREKGQITVPEGYSSTQAQEILDAVQQTDRSQTALIFHNKDGLSKQDMTEVEKAIQQLKEQKGSLGITGITSHFDNEQLKNQFVSEDGKTVLVAVDVHLNDRSASEVSNKLYDAINNINVDHYYTSGWMIEEDLVVSSQEGLKKTEYITVIFILIVLFIVFRSFIAPFVPLVTVGISYIVSSSIVAFLVEYLDFPLSNFTQIFMVAVLFGIGTDYCILLLSRFKEEMANHEELWDAIAATYKNAGRTVFFSGIAVMIGFAVIGFSTFKLYQSAAAVAVGIAVLLIALLTIVPFFMAVLGKKLFWPTKGAIEHRQSKLWGYAGRLSFTRPLITLLIVAAISAPFALTYDGNLSFNSLNEIGDDYNSVKAFNIISESFNPGESMPTTIVLKHDEKMDSSEYLALFEKITRAVEDVDRVANVRSVTRPTGEELKDLYVANQVETLDEGLGQGNEGIQEISEGLAKASTMLSSSAPELNSATDGISSLINGTSELKDGVMELQTGLRQLQQGLEKGSIGATELYNGLERAKTSANQLTQKSEELLTGYKKIGSGLTSLNKNFHKLNDQIKKMTSTLGEVNEHLEQLADKHPQLKLDPDFIAAQQKVIGLQEGSSQVVAGMTQLNENMGKLKASMDAANQGFSKLIEGQKALTSGLEQLATGMSELQNGIQKAAKGQGQIVSRVPALTNGLEQINNGQRELLNGFGSLDDQLMQLTTGLTQSVDGLNQVSSGLNSAQGYLEELSSASNREMAGWFIPSEVLASEEFQQVLDVYMSENRKVVTFDVVFNQNPYSTNTLKKIDDIEAAVKRTVDETKLENAKLGIGGVSSTYNDLQEISGNDYTRTVVLMLIGISFVLIILFRSFVMPLYLIGSLILAYFTTMGITEMIFVNILDYPGLNWTVPFFAFVILIALGVDYSIFLMDRFNEYCEYSIYEAMLSAMKNMGTVIISAVVILGGTFAAMLPSGVLSLLQIATVVLTGLLLYALVFLPLFVPVMVKTFGKANWWPWMK